MRIAMVSDMLMTGGAQVAARRLAEGLAAAGHDLRWVLGEPPASAPASPLEVVSLPLHERGACLAVRAVSRRWSRRTRSGLVRRRLVDALRRARPEVINVHNLHGVGWTMSAVEACLEVAPTVWTLHDMWSFTGRCAYSYECSKFTTRCDTTCPTPQEHPPLHPSLIAEDFSHRKRVFAGRSSCLVGVCPSHWLRAAATRGVWRQHQVEVIPYGVPLDRYRPVDRALARRALGLSDAGPVALTVAVDLTDYRKGGALLTEALARSRGALGHLITVGRGALVCPAGVGTSALGTVRDSRRLALAYNAADFVIHPALADNLPNVVLESLSCGTPVVAFDVGGLPDMVRPGVTGWLAGSPSADSLAEAIGEASSAVARGESLRETCRTVAEREYGTALQASRYGKLFAEVVAPRTRGGPVGC